MNTYEEFVKTTDMKVDDIQFYLDGYNEEHGEISGVIKRIRRGDYDETDIHYGDKCSVYLTKHGLKKTLVEFDECRGDLLKEIGDEHWYLTRFIQCIGLNWNNIEQLNMIKLKERQKRNLIIGKGVIGKMSERIKLTEDDFRTDCVSGIKDYFFDEDVIKQILENQEKLEKIKELTFHAGCMGNPDCVLCPIVKILEESKQ